MSEPISDDDWMYEPCSACGHDRLQHTPNDDCRHQVDSFTAEECWCSQFEEWSVVVFED